MVILTRLALILLGASSALHAQEHDAVRHLRPRGPGAGVFGGRGGGGGGACRECFAEGCFLDPIDPTVTDETECDALGCATVDCGDDFTTRATRMYCRRCNSSKCTDDVAGDEEDCKLCDALDCLSVAEVCGPLEDSDFQAYMVCRTCAKCITAECFEDTPPSQQLCDRSLCFEVETSCDTYFP